MLRFAYLLTVLNSPARPLNPYATGHYVQYGVGSEQEPYGTLLRSEDSAAHLLLRFAPPMDMMMDVMMDVMMDMMMDVQTSGWELGGVHGMDAACPP
jgi:hypothetical protein|mmetsp:Transcript_56482/g.126148  ORF Transcript_56482/g.126148 Transcript_56482/m.126148 type:complete len:97 (-) Transcript_56482:287-577(-)